MRSSSEVMKTKSTVRPSEAQRTVLNLVPVELGASRVGSGIIRFSMIRRDKVRQEGAGGERLHISSSNDTPQNRRPHFHLPTHNRPGRHFSTVAASRGISAAA